MQGRAPSGPSRRAPRALAPMLLALAPLAASCSPQGMLSILPGAVNDPGNLTLRREILGFGTGSMCKEVSQRSVALRFRNEDPALGRFFPRQCAVRELETGHLYIQLAGTGYAWSNVTKRVGFQVQAGIEYAPDFRLDGSTMYIYFRPVSTTARQFDVSLVEQGNLGGPAVGMLLPGGDPRGFVSQVGDAMLEHELGRGFTVIRESDGTASFGVGIVPPGQKPTPAFERRDDGRTLLENDRIEIHQEQRDYAGPFVVPDDGMALYVTAQVEGAPSIDILAVPRPAGEVWLQSYTTSAPAGPLPQPAMLDETVPASLLYRRVIRVPKGAYFLVLDNTSTAGRASPPNVALDDRAALVRLGVEVDDAP